MEQSFTQRVPLTVTAHRYIEQAVAQLRVASAGTSSECAQGSQPLPLRAIDATAGNGHDTLFLAQLLGSCAEVAAFDIQQQALDATAKRLREYAPTADSPTTQTTSPATAAIPCTQPEIPTTATIPATAVTNNNEAEAPATAAMLRLPDFAAVRLIHASHAAMQAHLPADWAGSVCAITFNLGYLPGGDKARVTLPDSTLPALAAALRLLAPGGLLSVLCYRGHPQGAAETQAILDWLPHLPPHFHAEITQAGADAPPNAPLLLRIQAQEASN